MTPLRTATPTPRLSALASSMVWRCPGEFAQLSTARRAMPEAAEPVNTVRLEPKPEGYPATAAASHSYRVWCQVYLRSAHTWAAVISRWSMASSGRPCSRRA